MPRDRIKLADAKALIADGHATPESIAANFDVEDDGSAETPAPAAPSRLDTARARVATPTLDRLGLTGEDVKAGRGPQPAGSGAKVVGAGVDAVTGVVDALGGLAGLGIDVATVAPRRTLAAAREFVRTRSVGAAYHASQNEPLLPATKIAGEASEDFRKTARKALGLDDSSETAAGPMVRLVTALLTPIPGARARPGVKVAEEAAPAVEREVAATAENAAGDAISTSEAANAPAAVETSAAASPEGAGSTLHVDSANPTPPIGEVVAAAKRTFAPIKELADGINPAGASEGAGQAAGIIRGAKAEISNAATVERYRNRLTAKAFERAGDESNIANISAFEGTGQFADAPAGYSEMYKETTDAAHATLQEVYGEDRVGYVDNYVRRAFKFGTEQDAAKATGVLSNYVGSLSASTSPLKGRVLGVPLDDALATMRNAGIDVKPVTTNPELLRQWTVENANQARVYKQAWTDAKDGNLISFVKQGDRVPQGTIQLDDQVAQVFRPTEEGPVRTGQYFAEPGVARIFNNAISKGLGGSPTFKAIRAMNNAYNQVQLGLSGFHLTGTAINAGISDLSLGLGQILNGDIGAGVKSIGRSAVPGYSFARDLYNGHAFVNDLVADDPVAKAFLADKLNPAGGRLAIDQAYRNTAYSNMVKAWGNKNLIRAGLNVPLAFVQKIASPLMEYAIPRVKIGAFMDLAEAELRKLGPNADSAAVKGAYAKAWDSIDNRFGQLVHDNLFWNRTAADLAQVSTRSVGWNLGTVRELGGGALDLAKGDIKSPRTLYAAALPIYAGVIGAAFQILHTGKRPETLRDYYYPQNGLTDDKGRPDRASLPTYMRDVFAYSTDPVTTVEHKASPLLSLAFDLGTNRDYFGDMIRNPEEEKSKQLLQTGSYALKQFQSFSVQQATKTFKEGGRGRAVEQIMGFPSAPGSVKQTSEDAAASKENRRLVNERKMAIAKAKHGG